MHARDRVIKHDQRTVTATCGMRVLATTTTFTPLFPRFTSKISPAQTITCVGCLAILLARQGDDERPQRANAEESQPTKDRQEEPQNINPEKQ